MLYNDAIENQ
jgi:signal transduction histidine kinase